MEIIGLGSYDTKLMQLNSTYWSIIQQTSKLMWILTRSLTKAKK